MTQIRVGCSGWHYKHWRGPVYPDQLPARRWLEAYAELFDCVEINNSFYRLPEGTTFAEWRARVPAAFTFAVKASRYLTHMRRLTHPEEPLARLLEHAAHLGPTLGPILYQLPPRFVPDRSRLEAFLAALPATTPDGARPLHHVLEFRDERCYTPETFRLLERHGASLCLHDMPGSATPRSTVGPLAYVRFHGFGTRYGGSYPHAHLAGWADWLHASSRPGFAFFNNDVQARAVANARTLRASLAV